MNCYSLSCIVLFLPIWASSVQWFLPFFSCWLETLYCFDFSFHFPKYEDLLQDSFKWNSIWHDAEWWPHCALKNGTSRILRGTIRHSFGHSSSSSVLSKTMIFCLEKKYCWVFFFANDNQKAARDCGARSPGHRVPQGCGSAQGDAIDKVLPPRKSMMQSENKANIRRFSSTVAKSRFWTRLLRPSLPI